MQQITTNELPETLRQLFTKVQRTKAPLTVTHEGEPLVVIYPAATQPKRPTFGAMKGTGEILGDLIAPALPANTWEALK
ncbi:MAG: type II toxin-antitoxin system Phd/YefM family antitoxin [Scytonema sp. PMC 1070.18]|nr:type II toxin-antitoxin system Phd/YefM family antitoxin [Scytonema sp. PMC 1070.18]